MAMRFGVSAILIVGAWCLADVHARQSFYGTGALPGAQTSRVTRISADGRVAAGGSFTPGLADRAFVWTASSGISEIPNPNPGQFIAPHGLSADGTCVVGIMASPSGSKPFRWTEATGAEFLSPQSGIANDVSRDGSVVAGFFGQYPSERVFRWTAAGITDVGKPTGWLDAWTAGLSADGSVIAGSGNSPAGGRAFVWTQSQGFRIIGDSETTLAYGVSGNAVVVGEVGPGNSHRAFRWSESHGLHDMGVPSGYWRARAFAASFEGDVVIGYAEDFSPPSPRTLSWVWTESQGFQDIHSTLQGVLPAGWTNLFVTSVSADGLTFGGRALHSGATEGWVATVPHPSSVAAFALVWALHPRAQRTRGPGFSPASGKRRGGA